eukprot:m.1063426 g.1063426  ORF g.1063426 m.1063426 type:complete len:69 (+) comp24216_c0_seq1:115-321(+)
MGGILTALCVDCVGRYAGGTIRGAGRLRHWFGYVFPSSGRDAVRCNACCWGGACAATYETNAWYVRLR